MATIKSVLDNLDNLDEGIKQFYSEGDDGKFYLNLADDVRSHPKTKPLQNAHERTKEALKTAKEERDALASRVEGLPEDFDADKLAELQAKADTASGVKIDEQLTALRQSLEEKHRRSMEAKAIEIAERDEKIKALGGEIKGSKIERELDAALDAVKVDPKHRRAVRALLRSDTKIEVSDEGQVVVETNQGYPMPLKEFVAEQAETDLKPYLMAPTGDGAGGNKGSAGGGANPFLPGQWNKTAQAKLPAEKRESLAKAAGFPSATAALSASKPVKAA